MGFTKPTRPAQNRLPLPNSWESVNYGDRYRNAETISSSFVESTVNEVISKRFVKRQQMRWTKPGAHHLLQVRIKVLNEELRATFCRWYPGMKRQEAKVEPAPVPEAAA